MTEAEIKLNDNKARAETAKLVAETSRINAANRWYPLILGSIGALAIVVVAKLFL